MYIKQFTVIVFFVFASCSNGYEKGKKDQFAADTTALKELIEENAKLKKEKEVRDFVDSVMKSRIEMPTQDTTIIDFNNSVDPIPDTAVH